VRAQGGFVQLGFPLSRIFDADPKGRNAGWTAYLYYGGDQVLARDARRFGLRGGRSDLFSGNIQYKWNQWVTFAYEEGYYRTRADSRTRLVAAVSWNSELHRRTTSGRSLRQSLQSLRLS
jgi:hypothetical protein